jgi:hypothetical protein
MKNWLIGLTVAFAATMAHAEYKMIVPQEPGGGTSVWASIIAKHLEPKLGEKIVIVHIPGARDIPGFNKFHNELRKDPKTIMVSHGGNAESFLSEKVDYNYKDYEPIGGMNLSIVTAYRSSIDPYAKDSIIKFAAGSGNNPDMMAFTLLTCGELPTLDAYLECYKKKTAFVKGMNSGERRLSFMRGELNATRESTAAFIKHVQPMIDKGEAKLWFSHGVLDLTSGKVKIDPNYPQAGSLEQVYKAKWGKAPKGPLYDAYILVKQYRDSLQKALWMDKGNPNALRVKGALVAMINDPEAQKDIERDSGKYEWLVGKDLVATVDVLNKLTTEKALKDLVRWQSEAFGVAAIYKSELVRK